MLSFFLYCKQSQEAEDRASNLISMVEYYILFKQWQGNNKKI